MKKSTFTLFLLAFLFPLIASAHGSHGSGFMAGFTHPILGLDHAFAIFGIGVLSYYLDAKNWYWYPLGFIIPMLIGGLIGIDQEATTLIEKIIGLSVVVIGLAIALFKPKKQPLLIIAIAIFGFFHGFAHGAEMPIDTGIATYISGAITGAVVLSLTGFGISKMIDKTVNSLRYYILIGGFLVGAGTMILI